MIQDGKLLVYSSELSVVQANTRLQNIFRHGEKLEKLETVTLDCIQTSLQTIEDAKGAPFNPRDCIQELVVQVLAVLVGCALVTVFGSLSCGSLLSQFCEENVLWIRGPLKLH